MDFFTLLMEQYPIFYTINPISICTRFSLAFLVGILIGIDRSRKRRPAGIKTHVLVCVGAAMVMMLSQYMSDNLGYGGDIGRIGAQVVSGIGFLGAGTILVTGQNHVRGLTTAAGLWCAACIGLAAGIGFYEGVLFAFLFILGILLLVPRLQTYVYGKTRVVEVYIEVEDTSYIRDVIAAVKNGPCRLLDFNVGKVKFSGMKGASIQATLYLQDFNVHGELMSTLGDVKGVRFLEEIGDA